MACRTHGLKTGTFDGPADGESALKETRGTQLHSCRFALRYPVWHAQDCQVSECVMTEGCRAPFWYCQDLSIHKSAISGAKALRECDNVLLNGCEIESDEFGWLNRGLVMENCRLTSGYPFFFCRDIEMRGLQMTAKYSFQYVENAVLRNCRLQTKDAFWHTKNVTVYDSEINGEYLGWYSEGLAAGSLPHHGYPTPLLLSGTDFRGLRNAGVRPLF